MSVMIFTTINTMSKRVYARCEHNGTFRLASVRWNPEAHEETNHVSALRRLVDKINEDEFRRRHWNGARMPSTKGLMLCWIAASGQRFTATT